MLRRVQSSGNCTTVRQLCSMHQRWLLIEVGGVRGDTDVMSTLERIPGLGRLVQRRQELLDDIVRTARVVEMQYVTVAVACSWVCVH